MKSSLIVLYAVVAITLVQSAVAADDEAQNIRHHPAVAAADWTDVAEIVVELLDNNYQPSDITLKLGRPYRLKLKNIGGSSHDMVGGTFFQRDVIALRMVNSQVGRVTADDISSVYIRPKKEVEIWFVPIKQGEYSFFCSIPGHRESGMEGGIKVVE